MPGSEKGEIPGRGAEGALLPRCVRGRAVGAGVGTSALRPCLHSAAHGDRSGPGAGLESRAAEGIRGTGQSPRLRHTHPLSK